MGWDNMFALFSTGCHGAKGEDVFGVGLMGRFGNKESEYETTGFLSI